MENLAGIIVMPDGQGAVPEAEGIIGFSLNPLDNFTARPKRLRLLAQHRQPGDQ